MRGKTDRLASPPDLGRTSEDLYLFPSDRGKSHAFTLRKESVIASHGAAGFLSGGICNLSKRKRGKLWKCSSVTANVHQAIITNEAEKEKRKKDHRNIEVKGKVSASTGENSCHRGRKKASSRSAEQGGQ